MELEDGDDLGTMIAIYCPLEMDNPSLVEFDPDLDDIPKYIDKEGLVDGKDVNPHSAGNMDPSIVIRNNPGAFMTDVDPNVALAREFPKYTNIVSAHLLDEEFNGEELFVGQ
ncbi:hypothetical protein GOBAR_DD12160 [Gossypium barbadense]|nr:hypothetical protein GOBAR_DD12160 [Gossypium barbadense]